MKLIKFKGWDVTYAEDQPEYLPVPAHKTSDGVVTSCWGLGFFERLQVVLTGRIYLQVLTFNRPLQPLKMSVDQPSEIVGLSDAPPGPPDCPRPKDHKPVG